MGSKNEMITCEYDRIVHKGKKAYLVDFGDIEDWIPHSIGKFDFKNKKVSMPEWLYNKLGLNDWKV